MNRPRIALKLSCRFSTRCHSSLSSYASTAASRSHVNGQTSQIPHRSAFSTSLTNRTATVGPFSWQAGALFVATGFGLWYYFTTEKAKMQEQKRKELETTSYGQAKVGGPFSLLSHEGKSFTQDDLLGHWNLIYFGFTNCPDICPEELDKMGVVVDSLEKRYGPQFQPIFISCDPARDTVERTKDYVRDFHPKLVGLTGTYEAVKATCKAYRVYFSTPPNMKPGDDYLVDHSIFFYLMDPQGRFIDAYGKNQTADIVEERVIDAMARYKQAGQ